MKLELEFLKRNYFLTGSKGIFGEHCGNDWDFALTLEHMPPGVSKSIARDLHNYCKVKPIGKSLLFPTVCEYGAKVDLLIYENQKDFEIVCEVTNEIKSICYNIPDFRDKCLKDKGFRIVVFEALLSEKIKKAKEQF